MQSMEGDAFTMHSLQSEGLKSYKSLVSKSIYVSNLAKIASKMESHKTPKFCTKAAVFLILC